MEIDYDRVFNISQTAMRTNRVHPDVPRDKKWLIQFVCMHTSFTLIYIILFYNMIISIKSGNYSEACRHFILNLIYYLASLQYFIIVAYQETIAKIIEMMKADFARDMSIDEKKIAMEYAKKGRKVSVTWLIFVIYTGAIFPIKHAFLESYIYITEGWKLIELYPLIWPSPIEEHKMHPVMFTIIYATLIYYIVYMAFMYLSFVPLGPTLMLHACGQLEIVKNRALALYADGSGDPDVKLKELVKQLQYIYGFIDCVDRVFRVVYELTMQATSFILPLTLYEVLDSLRVRGEFNIEFLTFIVGATLICSSPCYYSDKLMEKGEEVRLAMYSCGWERRYDHGVRTTLVVILIRALQPTAIRTMFRTVSLDALADMFHQAYTIFSLMNAAWG